LLELNLHKKFPYPRQSRPRSAHVATNLYVCKAETRKEANPKMPQLNTNVHPELWQAIKAQGGQGHSYDLSLHDISPVLTGAQEKLQ
jgi:hypothetical protein